MYTLALDTSTALGLVVLAKDGKVIDSGTSTIQKSHSDFIHVAIETILKSQKLSLNDMSLFICGLGPGSFTGIRTAGNAARAFSYVLNRPLVGVDTLTNLAHSTKIQGELILTLVNAYKNMNYSCLYKNTSGRLERISEPKAVPVLKLESWIDQFANTHDEFTVVGDGYSTYEKYIPLNLKARMKFDRQCIYPSPESLVTLGEKIFENQKSLNETMDWKSFMPLYIRASEAEENKQGILFNSLKK